MRILIINGPNLNLLGLREPAIYGNQSYGDLCRLVEDACRDCGADCEIYQSNHEGDLVDKIQAAYGSADGIVINPAAYTHTSVAILDALKAVSIPAVEVHISDVDAREPFRQISYTGMACLHTVKGLGLPGYAEAIRYLSCYLKGENRP
ncbi:MAG: type II 3-dehydroquinate dehydratase [Oscillospiraceae bacterium]|nr:type II 3-dehydroquinate dehydratase [Oscillospiraceae bacterium]